MQEEKTRLRVKLGAAEIEYEGGAEFLKEEVMPTVGRMLELVQERADLQRSGPAMIHGNALEASLPIANGSKPAHSTNTIASLLNVSSGSDLAIAAAARLILVDGKDTITRAELLKEMQSATTFYKATYSGNLSKALKTLTKDDRLRLVKDNTYSLSQKERQKLEQELAKAE
jgi:hypothetical protein